MWLINEDVLKRISSFDSFEFNGSVNKWSPRLKRKKENFKFFLSSRMSEFVAFISLNLSCQTSKALLPQSPVIQQILWFHFKLFHSSFTFKPEFPTQRNTFKYTFFLQQTFYFFLSFRSAPRGPFSIIKIVPKYKSLMIFSEPSTWDFCIIENESRKNA